MPPSCHNRAARAHAWLSTTQRYTEVDAGALIAVYDRAHPKARAVN